MCEYESSAGYAARKYPVLPVTSNSLVNLNWSSPHFTHNKNSRQQWSFNIKYFMRHNDEQLNTLQFDWKSHGWKALTIPSKVMSALVTDHTNIKCVNRLICSSSRVYDKMKKVEKKNECGKWGDRPADTKMCSFVCCVHCARSLKIQRIIIYNRRAGKLSWLGGAATIVWHKNMHNFHIRHT